jgi:hypothetical protein
MKRFSALLVLIALPLIAGTVTRTVTFSQGDLVFSRVDNYDVVDLKGYPALVRPGEPRLPRVMQRLVIPAGAVPTGVEVIAEDWVDLPGEYNIYPAHPDVPLPMPGKVFEPKEYLPNPEIYSSDNLYPEVKIRVSGAGTMSGYRLVHIELFPVRYVPAQGVLQLLRRMTYRLVYAEHRVPDEVSTVRQRDLFKEEVRALVVNPEDIDFCVPRVARSGVMPRVPPGHYEYVVVSESPLDTVFQRLADWKTKKGIPATVVLVSWINSNYTGYDLQEKIRNFIIDAQTNWGTIYVLLGGSPDYNSSGQNIVPARKGWYVNVGGPDNDYLPADLYYSDLDGDWDFNGNHTYGELGDSVDMYADVYVGRASVYNISMAQNFVYKVLTYEKNPPADYIERLMLPTGILWSSYEERPMQDSIGRMPPPGWRISKMYERNGNLSRQGMIDTMNVGYNLGHWEGHGNEDGIYYNGGSVPFLTSSDADNLVNGDREGIANAIACMCGGWDLVPSGGDCFAEHLVNRVGGGLAAAIMNSRYGWGAYVGGYVPGPSERIDTTFYAKIFWDGMYHLGQIHHAAKDAWVFYADSGAQYDMTRWCIYELNLFGCPEMQVWSATPKTLTVSYPGAIPIGNQNVDVTVTSSGSPLENALVCLQKGTETYASGYTNASGLVTLNVHPTSPGYMDITATAKNHYPFEDSLIVQSSSYAYVSYLSCLVSDPGPGGNNDGKLNPGESVQIPLWVKNWGQSEGIGIIGTLSSSDSYAMLSDTVKSFGNILPDDSAYTGADGYDLDVATNCPDGHGILFGLTCKDHVDSTWFSQFSLTVYAPKLSYQDVSVVGGNGNGILDPDETADLVVTIKNDGSAAAVNVTSTLLCSSPHITINDNSGNYGTIDPGNTANNSADPYNVTASASTPTGTVVNFQIEVVSGVYIDTLDFSLVVGKKHYYLWNPDPSATPGLNCHNILGTIGYSGDYGTTLAPDLTIYQAVLVCVGIYSSNYIISSGGAEATALVDFLQNQGGRMYLEGGDVWYYDPLYQGGHDFGPLFGIDATADGSGNMIPIIGQTGTFTVGMNFTGYTGENNYMDHISPIGTGFLIFYDTDNSYDCGVANDAGTYRTVGTSFELGLLTDATPPSTREALLDSIMKFFGIILPGVEENQLANLPLHTALGALYPNPGVQVMHVRYQVARAQDVNLIVYDAAGRLVRILAQGKFKPGYYTTIWDAKDNQGRVVPAGVYFVKFDTEDYTKTEKAILLR